MVSRYPAKAQEVDGNRFASKLEANRYGELKLLERAGQITGLRLQPAFAVEINGQPFCKYTADFSYWTAKPLPIRIVEEVKSSATAKDPAYRLRRKAAELYHGMTVTELVD